jgi:NAD(P)-dependent dehydrogenase (short-subunit alcohol dehydrogenase family)
MKYIITGAASGIGRAVSELAAADRNDGPTQLLLVDRNAAGLDEVAHQLASTGAKVITMGANLAEVDSAQRIVSRAEAEFGGVDVISSNAGIVHVALLKDLEVEAYDLLFDVNTRPTWLLGKAAHRLLARARGSIVATASISSEYPTPPLASYSASKAALVMLVKQMALEWGPDGIRCNCVSPGPTFTGMTRDAFNDDNNPAHLENRARRAAFIPLRKLGQPQEVARMILFLAGPQASQITGVNVNVDGGLTVAFMPAAGSGSGVTTS